MEICGYICQNYKEYYMLQKDYPILDILEKL